MRNKFLHTRLIKQALIISSCFTCKNGCLKWQIVPKRYAVHTRLKLVYFTLDSQKKRQICFL